jgi:hypothetical protein
MQSDFSIRAGPPPRTVQRLIFRRPRGKVPPLVKRLLLLFALLSLGGVLHAGEKKRFVLYAMMTENTPVELADGARWMMDKGDTFPVMMFKEQQTKVVLQLAGTSFTTETVRVQVIEEKNVTPEQLATYRANVANYIDSRAEKWKAEQAK